jgi:hypothetical protein
MVPKRLNKNAPLHHALNKGRGQIWAKESAGLFVPLMTLPVDSDCLKRLFSFIAKGLLWHHWQTYLTGSDTVKVMILTKTGERFFEQQFFRLNVRDRVAVSLGNDSIYYEGIQGVDCAQISVWRIIMFGGVWFSDFKAPNQISRVVGLITGPTELLGDVVARVPLASMPQLGRS